MRRSPIKSQATFSRIDPRRMVAATGLAATAASRLGAETFWAELRDRLGGWTATRPAIEGELPRPLGIRIRRADTMGLLPSWEAPMPSPP